MKVLSTLLLAGLTVGALAQPFSIGFARNAVVPKVEFTEAKPLPNGNFALLVNNSTTFSSAMYILNRSGTVVAARALAGAINYGRSLSVAPNGDIYAISNASTGNVTQVRVSKYAVNGAPLWNRLYNGGVDSFESVADSVCDAAGNLLVTGSTSAGVQGDEFSWVLRIRPNAVISFFNQHNTRSLATTLCLAGNGSIHALSKDSVQSYYLQLSGTGAFERYINLPDSTFMDSMASQGNQVYLAGSVDTLQGRRPILTAYQVGTTTVNWSTTYSNVLAGDGFFRHIRIDGAGSPIAAGPDEAFQDTTRGLIVKFNRTTGAVTWNRGVGANLLQGQNNVQAIGFELDRYNEAYFLVKAISPTNSRLRLDKIGPNGSLRGGINYPAGGTFLEQPQSLAVQPGSGMVLSGGLFGPLTTDNSRWVGFHQPATLVGDTFSTPMNTPKSGNAFTNDRYVGDVPATVSTQPAHGMVTMDGTTGAFTYTPNMGYMGADSFIYRIQNRDYPPYRQPSACP